MKSERKHELQTNSLAASIAKLPGFWERYGTKLLIAVILVALIGVFIYNQSVSRREAHANAQQSLVTIQEAISSLQGLSPWATAQDPDGRFNNFKTATAEISTQLDGIVATDDPAILSQALLLRGDFNWAVATYPELPAATTRPALALPADRSVSLADAEESYSNALSQYGDNPMVRVRANFGLAAIAEEKRDWATAAKHYQQIIDDKTAADAIRTLATENLDSLAKIQRPLFIAASTQPAATQPATVPVE